MAQTNIENGNISMATYAAVSSVLVETGKQKNAYKSV